MQPDGDAETRHLCTACWTEGTGSAPKACPNCGVRGAWFITAGHGGRPLREVLQEMFTDLTRPRVTRTPGLMGGVPCIDGTRVPVATVLAEIFAGTPDDEIHRRYPSLPTGSIDAAMEWAIEELQDDLRTRRALALDLDVEEDRARHQHQHTYIEMHIGDVAIETFRRRLKAKGISIDPDADLTLDRVAEVLARDEDERVRLTAAFAELGPAGGPDAGWLWVRIGRAWLTATDGTGDKDR